MLLCVNREWDFMLQDFQDTIVRIYIDREERASISGPLGLLHGTGFDDLDSPWGSATMGKLGSLGGGLYNSHRIPFSAHLRVTIETVQQTKRRGFYFMCRGLLRAGPVTIQHSQLQLPSTARLRTYATTTELLPTEWTTLFNVTGGGLLYMVTQAIDAESAHSLEGVHHAHVDGDPERLILSSGFEDYYLSAQYFDAGRFHTPLSGLSHHSSLIFPKRVSAYRFHTADPIVWSESFELRWRNGMYLNGSLAAKNATHRSVVWASSWPTDRD